MATLTAPTPAPLGIAAPFSDASHPHPSLPHPIPGVPAAPRVVYTDSHVRLTTETLVLKRFLPLYTWYIDLDEVRSIYPATEAERVGEPGGGRKGRVVWGMDLKNKRLLVDFGKGEDKRRRSVVLETKGFLRRSGFAVKDPEAFWRALDQVREDRAVAREAAGLA